MGKKKVPGVDVINESWVKKEIKLILAKSPNIMVDMPAANVFGTIGRHDFVMCHKGLFWSIEAKAGANTPTENQIDYALKVEKAGGISLMINEYNLDEAEAVARYIDDWGLLPAHLAHDFRVWRKNK